MRPEKLHLALGIGVCLLLPAASFVDRSGRLAYTMFAEIHWFRLELVGIDGAGRSHHISPSGLANAAGGSAGNFLAGAEVDRIAAVSRVAPTQLGALARFACAQGNDERVIVTFVARDLRGEIKRTTVSAPCR